MLYIHIFFADVGEYTCVNEFFLAHAEEIRKISNQ